MHSARIMARIQYMVGPESCSHYLCASCVQKFRTPDFKKLLWGKGTYIVFYVVPQRGLGQHP